MHLKSYCQFFVQSCVIFVHIFIPKSTISFLSRSLNRFKRHLVYSADAYAFKLFNRENTRHNFYRLSFAPHYYHLCQEVHNKIILVIFPQGRQCYHTFQEPFYKAFKVSVQTSTWNILFIRKNKSGIAFC